jgi:hypothetical protein
LAGSAAVMGEMVTMASDIELVHNKIENENENSTDRAVFTICSLPLPFSLITGRRLFLGS